MHEPKYVGAVFIFLKLLITIHFIQVSALVG
jgi:hypothetical protein